MFFPGSRYVEHTPYTACGRRLHRPGVRSRCPDRRWSRAITAGAGQRLDLIATLSRRRDCVLAALRREQRVVPDALANRRSGRHPADAPGTSLMPGSYQLLLNGTPADADLYAAVASVEVEESMDLPAALQLTLPVTRTAQGRLQLRRRRAVCAAGQLAIVASAGGASCKRARRRGRIRGVGLGRRRVRRRRNAFSTATCSRTRLHLETGTTNSTLTVWGQDASWLMNLTEKAKNGWM